jgi:hypothetical protein
MDLSHYADEPLPMIAARPDLVDRLLAEYRTAQMS